jgi:hypothetical protein
MVAGGAFAAAPAAADQSACNSDPSNIQVEFLGLGASNAVLVLGGDGYYTGNIMVHVYCGIDNSPVTGAAVSMWTSLPGSAIYDPSNGGWDDATVSSNPAIVNVPTGDQQITLRTSQPNLSGWNARVGSDTIAVTEAYGQSVPANDGDPSVHNGIWAQTPELDSLSLFGAGTAGLIGYALLRRRARGGTR